MGGFSEVNGEFPLSKQCAEQVLGGKQTRGRVGSHVGGVLMREGGGEGENLPGLCQPSATSQALLYLELLMAQYKHKHMLTHMCTHVYKYAT